MLGTQNVFSVSDSPNRCRLLSGLREKLGLLREKYQMYVFARVLQPRELWLTFPCLCDSFRPILALFGPLSAAENVGNWGRGPPKLSTNRELYERLYATSLIINTTCLSA